MFELQLYNSLVGFWWNLTGVITIKPSCACHFQFLLSRYGHFSIFKEHTLSAQDRLLNPWPDCYETTLEWLVSSLDMHILLFARLIVYVVMALMFFKELVLFELHHYDSPCQNLMKLYSCDHYQTLLYCSAYFALWKVFKNTLSTQNPLNTGPDFYETRQEWSVPSIIIVFAFRFLIVFIELWSFEEFYLVCNIKMSFSLVHLLSVCCFVQKPCMCQSYHLKDQPTAGSNCSRGDIFFISKATCEFNTKDNKYL